MRIVIVGAGAIGGFIAAALARAGEDVALVARGAHLEAIRRKGLHVAASDLGSFAVRLEAHHDVRALGEFDAALLTFKAHQWSELLDQLSVLSRTKTNLVTLQNGVPFWYVRASDGSGAWLESVDPGGRIGALFGDEQIIGGVVHVSGHLQGPGVVHQSGGTSYKMASLRQPQGDVDVARELTGVFQRAGLQAEIDAGIRESVWYKLVGNAGLNPVSALQRATIHQILSDPQTRAQVRALMAEAVAVGHALGVVREIDIDARLAYAGRLTNVRTSMLQDLEAGRPLELDPILGAVIELGGRFNVDVTHSIDTYHRLRELSPSNRYAFRRSR
jgi:2-dehydropantoate 2-reductase